MLPIPGGDICAGCVVDGQIKWREANAARRERIATALMQGIMASESFVGPVHQGCVASAADKALDGADALIARLDKP
jgi:hypothetical protein